MKYIAIGFLSGVIVAISWPNIGEMLDHYLGNTIAWVILPFSPLALLSLPILWFMERKYLLPILIKISIGYVIGVIVVALSLDFLFRNATGF